MEARVLNSITIVKGPNSLPKDISHQQAIERLAKLYKLVILISFGDDDYEFDEEEYILPPNVRHINYSYETIDSSLDKVRDCLSGFGVGLISRHLDSEPLPMLLTGSILSVPEGTELSVLKPGKIPEVSEEDLASRKGMWDIT